MSLPVSLPSPAVEAVTPPVRETPLATSEYGSYAETPTFAETLANQQEKGDANQVNSLNVGKKSPPETKHAISSDTLTDNTDASPPTENPKTEAEHPKHEPKKGEGAIATTGATTTLPAATDATTQLSRPELLLAQLLQSNSTNMAIVAVPKTQDAKTTGINSTGKPMMDSGKTTVPNAQHPTPILLSSDVVTNKKTENSMDSHTAKAVTPPASGVDFPLKPQTKTKTSSAFVLPDALKTSGDSKTVLTIGSTATTSGLAQNIGQIQGAAQPAPTPQIVAESVLRSAVKGSGGGGIVKATQVANKGLAIVNGTQTGNTENMSGVTATNALFTLDAPKNALNPLNSATSILRSPPELAVLLQQTSLTVTTARTNTETASSDKLSPEEPAEVSPTEAKDKGNPLAPLLATEGVRPQSEVSAVASASHRLAQTANAENAENAQKLETRTRIIAQVEKHTERMAAIRGTGEIDIRLEPEHLGALHIRIVKDGETVTARISAENQQVRQLLENGQQDLKDALKERGFQMQNLEFTNSATGNTGSGGQFSNAFAQADPNAQRSFSGSPNQNSQNSRGYREDNLEAGLAPKSAPNGRLDYRA